MSRSNPGVTAKGIMGLSGSRDARPPTARQGCRADFQRLEAVATIVFSIDIDARCDKAESLTHISVGQRPTYGMRNISRLKALRITCDFNMRKAFSLDSMVRRFVGRCPTLICVRASPYECNNVIVKHYNPANPVNPV